MRKISNLFKVLILVVLFFGMSQEILAKESDFNELSCRTEVNINKPWTVKFNLSLDKNTINDENIKVTNDKGEPLKVTITLGKDDKSIIVYPQVGGYIPGSTYYLNVSKSVKSLSGKELAKPAKMAFVTSKQYEDFTNYYKVPVIKSVNSVEKPIMENKKTSFNISSDYKGKVQYRVFAFKYPNEVFDNSNIYPSKDYIEITKGYTKAVDGSNYTITKDNGFERGKYKLIVYVKEANRIGENKDSNTDFDNYYTMYFKVLDNNILKEDTSTNAGVGNMENSIIVYKKYNKTLKEAIEEQFNGQPTYSEKSGWMKPSKNLIEYYMDSNNFLDTYGKYQFLNLNYMKGVTAEDLNSILEGKGILQGKGETFLKAAEENNINPIYLVSHALLETGNGYSKLSNGVLVNCVTGNNVDPKVTYNMFGVHAYDSDPIRCGSEYAYTQGWFTVDSAIIGGAKFIGTGYINSDKYNQNTLYKMRWNMEVSWHQYATDIGWSYKQIKNIKDLMDRCKGAKPVFEIPIFK